MISAIGVMIAAYILFRVIQLLAPVKQDGAPHASAYVFGVIAFLAALLGFVVSFTGKIPG